MGQEMRQAVPGSQDAVRTEERFLENRIPAGTEQIVVPVVAEEITLTKQMVESGTVRVTKRVETREEIIDEPLFRDEIRVERVPIERMVEGVPPTVRREGDVTIVPVLEEVLVVEKRLFLRGELRLTLTSTEYHAPQTITRQVETVQVERLPVSDEATPAGTEPAPTL